MKIVGKILGFMALAIAISGCMPRELWSYGGVVPGNPSWNGNGVSSGDVTQDGKALYVTGVEYPSGYAWKDSFGSDVECKIFLMKNVVRVEEITIRPQEGMTADPDMHRCSGGRLCLDYVSGEETVVVCGDEELFRIPGREYIYGFRTIGDTVHTVSCPREGGGWTYRENGESVCRSSKGSPMPGMFEDCGRAYFRVIEKQPVGEVYMGTCFYYVGGEQMPLGQVDGQVVYDFMLAGGDQCVLSAASSNSSVKLRVGDSSFLIPCTRGMKISDARLAIGEGNVGAIVRFIGDMGYETAIWEDGAVRRLSGVKVKAAAMSGKGLWCVSDSLGAQVPQLSVLCRDEEVAVLPEGYDIIYDSCLAACGENCCIALTDALENNRPALWLNGKLTDYDFNGFFTSVTWQ